MHFFTFLLHALRTCAHTQTGYIRPGPAGLELVICDPTGYAEVYHGSVATADGATVLSFATTTLVKVGPSAVHTHSFGQTPTAKDVVALTRAWRVEGATLRGSLQMAAMGQELQARSCTRHGEDHIPISAPATWLRAS